MARADLSVWDTPQSVDEILAALRQRVTERGGRIYFASGGELAWGVACVEGRVLRFLVTNGPGRSGQVFELVQDFDDDPRTSRTSPAVADCRTCRSFPRPGFPRRWPTKPPG